MKTFITKYLFLLIWIGALAAIGGIFVYVFQLNSHLSPLNQPSSPASAGPAAPPAPPAPSIDLTLGKSKGKNTITINWANLPGNTVALNIYRGKTGTDSSAWDLWKTLNIPPGQWNGQFQINLGTDSTNGYSFYVKAVSGNGGNSTSTSGGGGGDVLWTSDVTVPQTPAPTSTTPQAPPQSTSTDNGGQGNSSGTSNPPPAPPATPPTPPAPAPAPTPSGTPYYSPQIQISGYGGDQNNNFWVQHVDQKIQIGWQNLPTGTDSIVIYRSANQDGPWTTVLTQENPGTNGAYSIQIVDNTLGTSYYYEMNVRDSGGVTITTYGPVYLQAQ